MGGEGFQQGAAYGDTMAALGVVFSGLAFAALIITIRMQHHEIKLQRKSLDTMREELELAREDFKATAESQKEYTNAMDRQTEMMRLTALLTAIEKALQTDNKTGGAVSRAIGTKEKMTGAGSVQNTYERIIRSIMTDIDDNRP